MAGKDTKQTESADSGKSTGKSTSVNFRISLNDLMVLGFNMLKSGFGLIQSLEKMMDAKFQELVDKGELKPEDAEKLKHDISQSISSSKQKFSDKVSGGVRSTLNTLNIATLEDLKSLETRLDTLLETVDTIAEKRSVSRKNSSEATRATAGKDSSTGKSRSTAKSGSPAKSGSAGKSPARRKRGSSSSRGSSTSKTASGK